MKYSPSGLQAKSKAIAHAAIKRSLQDGSALWEGDATSGFDHPQLLPYPIGSRATTLPPVKGPTGPVRFFADSGATGDGDLPAGSQIALPHFPPGFVVVGKVSGLPVPGWELECDPWSSIYEPWMERIEGILEGWEALPDIERLRQGTDNAVKAMKILTPVDGADPTSGRDPDFDTLDVTGAISTLRATLEENINSDAVYAFHESYGPEIIQGTMKNQAQIALGASVILAGEHSLWLKASEDIMTLCAQGQAAFDYRPPEQGFEIALNVLKAFVDLAKTVTPSPFDKVLEVGSATIGVVQVLLPEDTKEVPQPPPLSGSTAEEVAQNFEETVRALNLACYHQEGELVRKAAALRESIAATPASNLHIHPKAGVAPGVSVEIIEVNPSSIRKAANNLVPQIASVYSRAAEAIVDAAPSAIWERHPRLGYGAGGAREECHDVLDIFDKIATGTARELVEAGHLLAQAAGDLERTDQEQAQVHRSLAEACERGSTGWTPPKRPVPPPAHSGVQVPV